MMTEEKKSRLAMYERKRELIAYMELLMKLKHNGIKCEQETNQALKELNSLMFSEQD